MLNLPFRNDQHKIWLRQHLLRYKKQNIVHSRTGQYTPSIQRLGDNPPKTTDTTPQKWFRENMAPYKLKLCWWQNVQQHAHRSFRYLQINAPIYFPSWDCHHCKASKNDHSSKLSQSETLIACLAQINKYLTKRRDDYKLKQHILHVFQAETTHPICCLLVC